MNKNLKSGAQNFYESYWSNPDAEFHQDPTTPQRWAKALSVLKSNEMPIRHVLDLGCGAGRFVALLSEQGFQAEGMDISTAVVEHARKSFPHLLFQEHAADVAKWPYSDGSFDAIVSLDVFEHLLDVRTAAIEARRVLRRGGRLVLSVPYHGLLKNMALVLFNFEGHFDVQGAHIRFFTTKSMRRLLSSTGFTVLSSRLWFGTRLWPPITGLFVVATAV